MWGEGGGMKERGGRERGREKGRWGERNGEGREKGRGGERKGKGKEPDGEWGETRGGGGVGGLNICCTNSSD